MDVLRKRARRAFPAIAVLAVAAFLVVFGVKVAMHEPAQISDYNRAMQAYSHGDIDGALQYLDKSLEDYDAANAAEWWQRAIDGRPNTEIAAMAHFHKGVLLLIKAQAEKRPGLVGQAVEELESSLELNPGAPYRGDVSPRDAQRLNEEALVVKHDLDLLFQKHPEQQQNGKPKPGQNNGPKQPAQPAPGQNPGDQPGHGNDDGI